MGRKDRIPDWQFRQIVDAIQEEQQGVRSGHGATRGQSNKGSGLDIGQKWRGFHHCPGL